MGFLGCIMRAMKIEMIRRMAKIMVATMVIIVKTQNEGGNNVIRRVENEESVDYRVGGRKEVEKLVVKTRINPNLCYLESWQLW